MKTTTHYALCPVCWGTGRSAANDTSAKYASCTYCYGTGRAIASIVQEIEGQTPMLPSPISPATNS